MSAGNSASKSSTRTIPPAFSRNTISSPRRKISTSELLTRNFLGSLTAWLFPDLNTRAMDMICLLGIYTGRYIHLQAPIPELWAEQRARSGNVWSDELGKRRSFRAGFNSGRGEIPGFFPDGQFNRFKARHSRTGSDGIVKSSPRKSRLRHIQGECKMRFRWGSSGTKSNAFVESRKSESCWRISVPVRRVAMTCLHLAGSKNGK